MLMQHAGVLVDVPDPMHLDPDVEQDEPLAIDQHFFDQDICYGTLKDTFGGPSCYITRDRWLLMNPRNPRDKLLPDLLVSRGVPQANRMEYDPVVEGKPPDLLGEFLSISSLRADLVHKLVRYQNLGVREYLVFNPAGAFDHPLIQGWDLQTPGQATPLAHDVDGGITVIVLPVRFVYQGGSLVIFDTRTGENLSDLQRARLHARLYNEARTRAETALQRIEADHMREIELRQQAEAERTREIELRQQAQEQAALAEARIRQLQAELDRLRSQDA